MRWEGVHELAATGSHWKTALLCQICSCTIPSAGFNCWHPACKWGCEALTCTCRLCPQHARTGSCATNSLCRQLHPDHPNHLCRRRSVTEQTPVSRRDQKRAPWRAITLSFGSRCSERTHFRTRRWCYRRTHLCVLPGVARTLWPRRTMWQEVARIPSGRTMRGQELQRMGQTACD